MYYFSVVFKYSTTYTVEKQTSAKSYNNSSCHNCAKYVNVKTAILHQTINGNLYSNSIQVVFIINPVLNEDINSIMV